MNADIVAILAIFTVVFVPVVGITARIALNPFKETINLFLRSKQDDREARVTEQRLSLLEQEVQIMRGEVSSLTEQKDFYRRLAEGGTTAPAGDPRLSA
jgi:hypothetical protein